MGAKDESAPNSLSKNENYRTAKTNSGCLRPSSGEFACYALHGRRHSFKTCLKAPMPRAKDIETCDKASGLSPGTRARKTTAVHRCQRLPILPSSPSFNNGPLWLTQLVYTEYQDRSTFFRCNGRMDLLQRHFYYISFLPYHVSLTLLP